MCVAVQDTAGADYEAIDIPNYYSSADKVINDGGKSSEAIPYMDPSSTTVKDHPKALNNDYEALPALNIYETPGYQVSDALYQNEMATDTSAFRDSIKESTVGEALSDDEQIYEDPGHNKEEIYAWFEEKRFWKIKTNYVRCVEYHIASTKLQQEAEFSLIIWRNGKI